MDKLDAYPFLKAALDDMQLVAGLVERGMGTPRHIVSLLHDALECILYECLLAIDQDIYKNGQNTIGFNSAIDLCRSKGIDLPLIGAIRAIQKHRGDARHHAQVPHDVAFERMMGEFRVVAARLVCERFGQVLASQISGLGLLPYHDALYRSYRKYRTHDWDRALRFALGALLHKHRSVFGEREDYSVCGTIEPLAMLGVLSREICSTSYPPATEHLITSLAQLPEDLRVLIDRGQISDAAEIAGRGYSQVDEVLPGMFRIDAARRLTSRLFSLDEIVVTRAMSWTKWQGTDTAAKRELESELRSFLKGSPLLVRHFGDPHHEDDDDRYWSWWEFAIFDGSVWHTFLLDCHFELSLETGSVSEQDATRRERVAKLVLDEFGMAAENMAAVGAD